MLICSCRSNVCTVLPDKSKDRESTETKREIHTTAEWQLQATSADEENSQCFTPQFFWLNVAKQLERQDLHQLSVSSTKCPKVQGGQSASNFNILSDPDSPKKYTQNGNAHIVLPTLQEILQRFYKVSGTFCMPVRGSDLRGNSQCGIACFGFGPLWWKKGRRSHR